MIQLEPQQIQHHQVEEDRFDDSAALVVEEPDATVQSPDFHFEDSLEGHVADQRTSGRVTRNSSRGRPKTQKCPQRKIPVSPIQRFQRPMTQSQEIDGLAKFDLKLDPKYRAVAWHGTMQVFAGYLISSGCSPGPALESAQLHVHRQLRKRKKSKAVHMHFHFEDSLEGHVADQRGVDAELTQGRPKTQKCPQRKIPVSRIQRLQRAMTQSQEIDGLAEFDPEISSTLAPLWSQLITRAPATEETEEIQGGTYASFINIDDEREKYASKTQKCPQRKIRVSPIQRLQRPMTQSQEIDGLCRVRSRNIEQ
ncbi:hypothetical protein MMC22_006938 [Lobaria immixta]|nr:hypothetical protein [Lobaria immixta]